MSWQVCATISLALERQRCICCYMFLQLKKRVADATLKNSPGANLSTGLTRLFGLFSCVTGHAKALRSSCFLILVLLLLGVFCPASLAAQGKTDKTASVQVPALAPNQNFAKAADQKPGKGGGLKFNLKNKPAQAGGLPVKFDLQAFALGEKREGLLFVLRLKPDPGVYTYANDPGEGGKPTLVSLTFKNIDDPLATEIIYPLGRQISDAYSDGRQVNVYDAPATIFISLPAWRGKAAPEASAAPSSHPAASGGLADPVQAQGVGLAFDVNISLLLCSKKNCLPAQRTLSVDLTAVEIAALPLAQAQLWWPEFETARALILQSALDFTPQYALPDMEIATLGKALLFALLAGFILNFMPCVFPVLSLKLLGFMMAIGEADPVQRVKAFRRQNFFFALGVLASFSLLAAVIMGLNLLWGQIFQSQGMVLAMLLLVFALTLSMFGLFNLPAFAWREGSASSSRHGSFLTGMLVTLLATPCSGPLLGGVLGWSFNQPQPVPSFTFFCVGLGMAAPYLLLALFPRLAHCFPRPGRWLSRLELVVGFFLLLTCAYLFSLLFKSLWLMATASMLGIVALGFIYGRYQARQGQRATFYWRWLLACLLMLALLISGWYFLSKNRQGQWEDFNLEYFSALQGTRPIVLDFTADWCPNCKVLENTVFTADLMREWQKKYGAVFMQVDLTRDNPEGYALLASLGSNSLPVVALFPASRDEDGQITPLVLRDLFGAGQLQEAAEQIWQEKLPLP